MPYTNNLIANRGTDNRILIEFVNQDQKPVDITDKQFTLRLMTNESLILEKELLIVNALRGQANIVLTEEEIDTIETERVGFSIEQHAVYDEPVFVDDNAGARGQMSIVDSIMPKFIASKNLELHPPGVLDPEFTDIINTEAVKFHTFQFNLTNFTGTLTAQGASSDDGNWYDINSNILSQINGTYFMNVEGYHPFLRFHIHNVSAGTVDRILYR